MKYVMIAICVISVVWAVVNRLAQKNAAQVGQVEVPANAGPTYASVEIDRDPGALAFKL